jgi:predicted N-acetyltransferase YhbS
MQYIENKVISAFEVEENELIEFYSQAFENRMKYLPNIWKWLNRSDFYANKTPFVIEREGKVIAHAGIMPFFINLEGEKHTASWLFDFKISDNFQRQGLGSILTEELINLSDCCFGFCNEKH